MRIAARAASVCVIVGLTSITSVSEASSFQIWEQDGASVGNYHAGYAALLNDASASFYNPAGITRIKNQQAVFAVDGIRTSFEFEGSVATNTLPTPMNVKVNGGVFAAVPSLHYVAPINDKTGFGFSVVVPFGLKTNYGDGTPLRYAATMSSLDVLNVSAALAYQFTEQLSLGAGVDYQRIKAELDSMATLFYTTPPPGFPDFNTSSTNKADGNGYGYHLGALYSFTPQTRVGASYHSQVKHHLTGTSKFYGRLASPTLSAPALLASDHANVDVTLPAYTALSAYHKFHPQFAIMGTAIYTQWNVFELLTLNNFAGRDASNAPSTSLQVQLPEYYRNTWNFSVGADYYFCNGMILRGGLGYDQTPVRNQYRDLRVPDNDRYVVALGGHYQATKTVGFDLGWSHFFVKETPVHPPRLVVGAAAITTNGKINGGADVLGAQVTWDIV